MKINKKWREKEHSVDQKMVKQAVKSYLKNGGKITKVETEIEKKDTRFYRSGTASQFI
jgi:hypothetical protein